MAPLRGVPVVTARKLTQRCGGIFTADPGVPADPLDKTGLAYCLCGLRGQAGDAHHTLPAAGEEQDEHRRRAGDAG